MATAGGPHVATPSTALTDDQRRWVVIGICLNKLLTPVLRTVLGNEIPKWYNNLCHSLNINRQTYKKRVQKLPPSKVKLNYGNINNNFINHKSSGAYNCDVIDAESLAKLFVQPFMAKFTGFDQTMDLSAALSVMCEADPFHMSAAVVQAKKVRSDLRNKWAHCNFSYWSDVNYQAGIQEIETLVKKLKLSGVDETEFLNELNNWKDNGVQLCCGQPVDPELLKMFKTEIAELYESVEMWREENTETQSQLKKNLHAVQQLFSKEIQDLRENQATMGKDIEDIKVKQESLSAKYGTTSEQLEALENKVAALAIRNEEIPYLFMLPDRTEWFSGRESELIDLRSLLQTNEEISEPKVQIASVCGLGGNGKTSLAAEYAHQYKEKYDGGIFWFSGEDEATFAKSVDEHAVYLGTLVDASPSRTLLKTLEAISKIQKPWLLVLDDMDEYNLCSNIGMLLSGPWKRHVGGSGHILITTRRKAKVMSETIRGFKESQCLNLECFNPEDGKRFVFKRTGLDCNEDTSIEAGNLVEALGGLPLALEQACAYISNLSCSLSMYLEQYKQYSLKLLCEQEASPASLYESPERLAVRTTWQLNFDYIEQSPHGNCAVRFLRACAFFNPNEIQKELINPGKPLIQDEAYRDYVGTPLGSSHILKLLSDFSLFKKNRNSSLSVHRLVQDVIRVKLKSDDEEMLSLVDAISMLSFAFSKCPSPDDLLASDINRRNERASTLVTNPSLFYSWKTMCVHAHEVLAILNELKVLDRRILMPETGRIIYECSLNFNVTGKTDEAMRAADFAHKIIDLSSALFAKSDLTTIFPHKVPLSEKLQRYIFYSCVKPSDALDSRSSDKHKEIGSSSKIKQIHEEGLNHFNRGNFKKSVEMYTSAIGETSYFVPELLCDRALAYIYLSQYENALNDSEKCLLKRPKFWLGFAMKALALHGLNQIWEASCFAALAFYNNKNIFCDYEPFKTTFSILECRIIICNLSSILTDWLWNPVSNFNQSEFPGSILMLERGNYLVNVDDYPATTVPSFSMSSTTKRLMCFNPLFIDNCILLGVENSKSSAVIRFQESLDIFALGIAAIRRAMAVNISFVFSKGNWETRDTSVTTLVNCSFTSGLEDSNYTFLSQGTDTFRDCFFENCKSPGLNVMGKAYVERCEFFGGEYSGISVSSDGRLKIKKSKLYANYFGIYIAKGPRGCNIGNCEIFDNQLHGIFVTESSSNVKVENCRIYQNDRHGICIDDNSSAFISNNEIFQNGWKGISTVSNGRCTVSHNKIYENKSGGVQVVPVDLGRSPSIVEFNEIFNNRGHGIYCEMMVEDFPSDTAVLPSASTMKKGMRSFQKEKFLKTMCNENKCYDNEDTASLTTSKFSGIDQDYCSYCHSKCSSNCAKCFVTTYCNKECQQLDWKKHKKECRSILEKCTYTVRINIPLNRFSMNLEHTTFALPFTTYQHPGLAPKGSKYAHTPKVGERFLVKILAADDVWHSDSKGPRFTICDRSMTFNGSINRKQCPELFDIVRECGVSSTLVEGWKKKFFWAQLCDEKSNELSVFTTRFPPHEDW